VYRHIHIALAAPNSASAHARSAHARRQPDRYSFPTKVRHEIVAAGRAQPHHILPDSGWISFYVREPADVEQGIELLRLSFDLAVQQKARGAG